MLTPCVVIQATQIYQKENKEKSFYSVKQIFQEGWEDYLKNHEVREIEKVEVEKMLSCKDNSRGGFWYYCKNCNEYLFVPFGCNSRLCSCCGKRYSDQWASMLAEKLIKNIFHRHLVFGIPDMLWNYFHDNRRLFKVLMDVAYKTIREVFSKMKRRKLIPVKNSEGRVCYCPKCFERMEFVFYSKKDVPPDKNKLSVWLEMKRLS